LFDIDDMLKEYRKITLNTALILNWLACLKRLCFIDFISADSIKWKAWWC